MKQQPIPAPLSDGEIDGLHKALLCTFKPVDDRCMAAVLARELLTTESRERRAWLLLSLLNTVLGAKPEQRIIVAISARLETMLYLPNAGDYITALEQWRKQQLKQPKRKPRRRA